MQPSITLILMAHVRPNSNSSIVKEVLTMKPNPFPTLPAKNFVFPVLRPLLTILKCLKAQMNFEEGTTPVVLKRECLSNAGYLEKALTELCNRAGIDAAECDSVLKGLRDQALWKSHPVDADAFRILIRDLESFCLKHKSALGSVYRQDKKHFGQLYRDSVLKRKVLIVHSPNDAPDVLKENLSKGGYYEVETRPLAKATESSARHHVTVFLCTDSKEATEYLVRRKSLKVDLFLSNLGRELPIMNMNLCRLVNQAQRSGVKFLSSPYVTMKLLPAIEDAYVRHLEAFDRVIAAQEDAMAREEDALVQGVEEAMLYAELIVESAWKKTAGFSMEQSLT